MFEKQNLPDFNPAIFLGLALSFLPQKMLEYSAQKITKNLNNLHPNLGERLSDANGKSFALVLEDMQLNAILYIDDGRISCNLLDKFVKPTADVIIQGTSTALLDLLEGRCDGDALFFSRTLNVEGDTEALLVLRNALDNEQILLRDIVCSMFGRLSGVASHVATPLEKIGGKLGERFARDMNFLYHSAISPLVRRQTQMAENLQNLERRFEQMERAFAKKQARGVQDG